MDRKIKAVLIRKKRETEPRLRLRWVTKLTEYGERKIKAALSRQKVTAVIGIGVSHESESELG